MKARFAIVLTRILQLTLIGFALLTAGGAFIAVRQADVTGIWFSSFKNIVGLVIVALGVLGGCGLLIKIPNQPQWNRRVFWLLLLGFAVVFIVWIYSTPIQQTSDYRAFWRASQKVLANQPLYHHDNDYFAKWAYQTGYLTYVLAIVKIFGAHLRILQLLNVFWQLLCLALTYILAQRLFHQVTISRISLFLLGINWEWWALNNRLSNQYIASVFFLLTWLLLTKHQTWAWLLAGVTLAVGNILRPLGIVLLAAILVYALVYRLFQHPTRQAFLQVSGLVVVYLVVGLMVGAGVRQSGLNAYGLSNRDSQWKFVVGLNYESTGGYSQELTQQFDLKASRHKMLTQEKRVTRQHLQHLTQHHLWLKLFIKKFWVLWSQPSNALDFSLFARNHAQPTVKLVALLAYAITFIEIILLLIGAFSLWSRSYAMGFNLLLLTLFAYAAAQLLIEVQGRYRLEFVPILVMVAAMGVMKCWNWVLSRPQGQHARMEGEVR